jgi:hypothetical protein
VNEGSASGSNEMGEVDGSKSESAKSPAQFSVPGRPSDGYTDGHKPWEWKSKYDADARLGIAYEEKRLLTYLALSLALAAFSLSLAGQEIKIPLPLDGVGADNGPQKLFLTISCHILAIFFAGWVGGTTFALKWLVHACATGKWHLDRRPWRLIVPLLGGVYSCVMLTLLDAGMFGHSPDASRPLAVSAALAFLVGYFSDGVSGLLSNIANAVFGTLEKK